MLPGLFEQVADLLAATCSAQGFHCLGEPGIEDERLLEPGYGRNVVGGLLLDEGGGFGYEPFAGLDALFAGFYPLVEVLEGEAESRGAAEGIESGFQVLSAGHALVVVLGDAAPGIEEFFEGMFGVRVEYVESPDLLELVDGGVEVFFVLFETDAFPVEHARDFFADFPGKRPRAAYFRMHAQGLLGVFEGLEQGGLVVAFVFFGGGPEQSGGLFGYADGFGQGVHLGVFRRAEKDFVDVSLGGGKIAGCDIFRGRFFQTVALSEHFVDFRKLARGLGMDVLYFPKTLPCGIQTPFHPVVFRSGVGFDGIDAIVGLFKHEPGLGSAVDLLGLHQKAGGLLEMMNASRFQRPLALAGIVAHEGRGLFYALGFSKAPQIVDHFLKSGFVFKDGFPPLLFAMPF